MKRKTPIKHKVRTYKRNRKVVQSYIRGKGLRKQKHLHLTKPTIHSKSKNLFTKEREEAWINQDADWKEYKLKGAHAAYYKGVAFFRHYMPLWRFHNSNEPLNFADPNTVYALNYNDYNSEKFDNIVDNAEAFFNDLSGLKIVKGYSSEGM